MRPSNTIFLCILILTVTMPVLANPRVSSPKCPSSLAGPAEGLAEKQVREFVEAFNSRDVDRMISLVDENIEWLQIDGSKITVNTSGKAALRESMTHYFRSCPSCKSSLEWVQTAGNRTLAMERASWTSKQGPKSQSSLSVYEFRDGKILRVYYFPAEVALTQNRI